MDLTPTGWLVRWCVSALVRWMVGSLKRVFVGALGWGGVGEVGEGELRRRISLGASSLKMKHN